MMNTQAIIGILYIYFHLCMSLQEAPDGSVCFDNCSGHGDCVDYSCRCWVGYHGDSCSVTFADENNVVPILSVGDFNLTRKNFTQGITKNNMILVGFSSFSCWKCIQYEPEYVKIHESLKLLNIPFARVDVDKLKTISLEHGANELPALILFYKNKPLHFKGIQSQQPVVSYIQKILYKSPVIYLKTKDVVVDFIDRARGDKYSLATIVVIGFFSDIESLEQDDYDDFLLVAEEFKTKEDIYFGIVTDEDVSDWFIENKTIDRTPSFLLVDSSGEFRTINANEFYGEKHGISEWILKNSVPTVGMLTNNNFQLYEKMGLPMLMLFLDMSHAISASKDPTRIVGGKSGGILNEVLLQEFRNAAKDHIGRISFVYLDGVTHQDQMRSVGLYGGPERLPSLAFNTRDGAQIPFPETLAVNKDTILEFCANFLAGKLRSKEDIEEMAKKSLQAVNVNNKNTAVRKERKKAPEQVRGISEQFGDGAAGDTSVVSITSSNFLDIVMDEEKDVLVLFHSKSCESCAHFSVYYKRMAQRFSELGIKSLIVGRMDVTDETPPPELGFLAHPLPLMVLVPSDDKSAPWKFYSGVGKVQPMMKWVQSHAGIPFDLPNLPHLSEADRVAYKEQVREREIYKEKKREEEQNAMQEEEKKKEEFLQKLQSKITVEDPENDQYAGPIFTILSK